MKKLLTFLLILTLTLALAACGAEETDTSSTGGKTESTPESLGEGTPESTAPSADESIPEENSQPAEESTPDVSQDVSDETSSDDGTQEEVMTPEEIFTTLEGAGGNLKMTVDIPNMMTMVMESENDSNGSHAISTVTVMGESESEETYTQWIGDEAFVYSKDENGNWYKEQVEPTENESSFAAFSSLFTSDAYQPYDPATGRYVMKEGFTAEWDGFTLSNGYLEAKNGTYTLHADMAMSMEGASLSGTMTLVFSNLGGVTITFPQVTE